MNKTTNTNSDMTNSNCFNFSYMGVSRFVCCELGSSYKHLQELVAKTFRLHDGCIPAIQFSDGRTCHFSKDIFERHFLLAPQPEQRFYVRLDITKIKPNTKSTKERKQTLYNVFCPDNKPLVAAPLKRSNCFLGALPASDSGTNVDHGTLEQPRKRRRLIDSVKESSKKIVIRAQVQRRLRF